MVAQKHQFAVSSRYFNSPQSVIEAMEAEMRTGRHGACSQRDITRLRGLDSRTKLPVIVHMLHGDGNDRYSAVRVVVQINDRGDTVTGDIPISVFNDLPVWTLGQREEEV